MKSIIFLFVLIIFGQACQYRNAPELDGTSFSFNSDQVSLGGILAEQLTDSMPMNSSILEHSVFSDEINHLASEIDAIKMESGSISQPVNQKWYSLQQNMVSDFEKLSVEDIKSWFTLNDTLLKYSGEVRFADELEKLAYNISSSEAISESMIKSVAYTHMYDRIYLNIFGSSVVEYQHTTGGQVRLIQDTKYPYDGSIILKLEMLDTRYLDLFIRIPEWADRASVSVKGVKYNVTAGQYTEIAKKWKNGDEVEIIIGLRPSVVKSETDRFAFQYGSLFLAYEKLTENYAPFSENDPIKYMQFVSPPGKSPTFTFNGLKGETIVLQPLVSESRSSSMRTLWIDSSF